MLWEKKTGEHLLRQVGKHDKCLTFTAHWTWVQVSGREESSDFGGKEQMFNNSYLLKNVDQQ